MKTELKQEYKMDEGIFDIIIKQLKGLTNSDERVVLSNWINENDTNKRAFDEISDIWSATTLMNGSNPFNSKLAFEKVKKHIYQPKPTWLSVNINMFKVAASIIVAFGLGFLCNKLLFNKQLVNPTFATEIKAPIGSKSKVVLPDGTNVWINAGSTIRYSNNFNIDNREVKLEGEAYFDVQKNKDLPFRIQTHDSISIKVLGTAFNIKAYVTEETIETTLERGSLIVEHQLANEIQETKLTPNQRATFSRKENKIQVSEEIDPTIFSGWKDNKLIFRNESFENLVVKLERWYGVTILIKDKEIRNYHFNGTIQNESIDDVMKIIKFTLPVNYTLKHNYIVISKKSI